jgi:hypothetical protein
MALFKPDLVFAHANCSVARPCVGCEDGDCSKARAASCVILNPADWFSRTLSAVVPAHAGTHIPEAVVMGPRFRGDDRNMSR